MITTRRKAAIAATCAVVAVATVGLPSSADSAVTYRTTKDVTASIGAPFALTNMVITPTPPKICSLSAAQVSGPAQLDLSHVSATEVTVTADVAGTYVVDVTCAWKGGATKGKSAAHTKTTTTGDPHPSASPSGNPHPSASPTGNPHPSASMPASPNAHDNSGRHVAKGKTVAGAKKPTATPAPSSSATPKPHPSATPKGGGKSNSHGANPSAGNNNPGENPNSQWVTTYTISVSAYTYSMSVVGFVPQAGNSAAVRRTAAQRTVAVRNYIAYAGFRPTTSSARLKVVNTLPGRRGATSVLIRWYGPNGTHGIRVATVYFEPTSGRLPYSTRSALYSLIKRLPK